MSNKQCQLYDRDCTGCGECDICDITAGKVCDNCGACIQQDSDFAAIEIDEIMGGEPL